MKNGFKKFLAISAIALTGGLALTGCTMTDEQMAAVDTLTNNVDELVEVIDKQNKQLSKQEAMEMLRIGRSRTKYLWDVDNFAMNINAYQADTINELKYKVQNQTNDGTKGNIIITQDATSGVEYQFIDNNLPQKTLGMHNDKTNKYYDYDEVTDTIVRYGEHNRQWTDGIYMDIFESFYLDQIYEEDIYNIEQKEDGSYVFTVNAVKTGQADSKGTDEIDDDTFGQSRLFLDFVVKDGKIVSIEGYAIFGQYQRIGRNGEELEKNENDYYIIDRDNAIKIGNEQWRYAKVEYTYDSEVNLTRFNEMKAKAEAKYAEVLSQSE